jgi:YggT family protein
MSPDPGAAVTWAMVLAYWPYFLVNYVLSMLLWTCIGRMLLGLFVAAESANAVWRVFRFLTDPVIRLVAVITPSFVVPGLMPLVAAFWLFVARVLFWMLMYNLGMAPRLGGIDGSG